MIDFSLWETRRGGVGEGGVAGRPLCSYLKNTPRLVSEPRELNHVDLSSSKQVRGRPAEREGKDAEFLPTLPQASFTSVNTIGGQAPCVGPVIPQRNNPHQMLLQYVINSSTTTS